MERIAIGDVASVSTGGGADRRGLTDPLGAAAVAINHYCLSPDERISGLHAHPDQEEVFVVVGGEATFETLDGEVAVGPREAIRFAPGEFQSCKNAGDGEAVVLALGAPRDAEDVRVPVPCPACERDDRRPEATADGPVLVCPDCGAETAVACPACGSDDVAAGLGDDGTPVDQCRACGETFEL